MLDLLGTMFRTLCSILSILILVAGVIFGFISMSEVGFGGFLGILLGTLVVDVLTFGFLANFLELREDLERIAAIRKDLYSIDGKLKILNDQVSEIQKGNTSGTN